MLTSRRSKSVRCAQRPAWGKADWLSLLRGESVSEVQAFATVLQRQVVSGKAPLSLSNLHTPP